jgi:GEVED domain/Pregnancy-associated plasma protein-A
MRKILYNLLIISTLYSNAFAQKPCNFKDVTDNEEKIFQTIMQTYQSQIKAQRASTATIYIPVQILFARTAAGVTTATMAEVNHGLARATQQFKAANIELYICGTDAVNPKVIDNDTLYVDGLTKAKNDSILTPFLSKQAHNLLFQNSLGGAGGYSYGNTHYWINNRSHILNGEIYDEKVLAHEMGHWLSLAHTFRNMDKVDNNFWELVTRNSSETLPRLSANCSTQGDFVCDTPADPRGRTGGTQSGCDVSGNGITVFDQNGDAYRPMLNNIMSYTFCSPPQIFTQGQIDRMLAGYAYNNTPSTTVDDRYSLDCAETTQPAITNLTTTLLNSSVNLGVRLTWQDNSSVETGYFIERTTNLASVWETIGATDKNQISFDDLTTILGAKYYYRIKPTNCKSIYNVTIPSVTMPSTCAGRHTGTCAIGNNSENFEVKTMANVSIFAKLNTGCSSNQYGDYLTDTIKIEPNITYKFTYKTGYSGGYYPQHCGIFVDLNNDGDFDDAGELVYQSTGNVMNGTTSITDNFIIPAGYYPDAIRLRVRSRYKSDGVVSSPCDSYFWGETDDFTLKLKQCLSSLTFASPTDDLTNKTTNRIAAAANGSIRATNKIAGSSKVLYRGKVIELNNGFSVNSGVVFKAEAGGCN